MRPDLPPYDFRNPFQAVTPMRLAVFPKPIHGRMGLDCAILEPDATLADLNAAFAPYADAGEVYKGHLRGAGPCLGCQGGCCTTSIIAPDLLSFRATMDFQGLTAAELAERTLDPEWLARGVVHYRSQPCIFLRDNRCSIYPVRSVICRTFICCDYTPDLEDLVHNSIGAGLAALREFLAGAGVPVPAPDAGVISLAATPYQAEFLRFYTRWALGAGRLEEEGELYPGPGMGNPFCTATGYEQVPLRPFCTAAQWQRLCRSAAAR